MSILLGGVTVPSPTISGTLFPLGVDYPFVKAYDPKVAIHQFGSLDAKVEQRFLLGLGSREFQIVRHRLNPTLEASLRNFWIANNGAVGLFPFNAPNQDGSTSLVLCRFKDDTLSLDAVQVMVKSVGLTLCQMPNYAHSGGTPGTWTYTPPSYSITSTVTRFPSGGLTSALLQQQQTLFPIIKIMPLDPAYPAIYISDRDVTLGGQLYQARLLQWSGIEQYMVGGPSASSGGSDQATFVMGNADRVMSALKNDTDLNLARIEFSVFHADTGTKIDFWAGQISQWEAGIGDPEFTITATDGFSELAASYPTRTVVRTCWKTYHGGSGQPCNPPGTLDTVDYPSATLASCDKGYSTANGCLAHNNGAQWGGIDAQPQGVSVLVNNTGFIGFNRQSITSYSVISDSAFNSPLPEIWCDMTPFLSDTSQGMPTNPIMMAYRDESDFADSLSIIGAGPLTEFAHANGGYASHFMDGVPYQGWNADNSKLNGLGLRLVVGNDPTTDLFAMGQSSNGAPSTYGGDTQYCAGTAFAELRIKKSSTFVPSTPESHQVLLTIRRGLQAYRWSGVGGRLSLNATANPIWVAVNAALRTKGYFYAGDTLQETLFDANDAAASGAVCDATVAKLIGTGTESQFAYNGIISDRRALRDWIEDILSCCLGYYWIKFGKLSFGIRDNASAVEAFNSSNIKWNSLKIRNANIGFDIFTGNFGDVEFNFQKNSVMYWDEDFAKYWGGNSLTPKYIPKEMNSSGICTKSQMARVAVVRTREETGGIGTTCVKYHSEGSFSTTILSLNVAPGMVCSMGASDTMLDLPNYPASADGVDSAQANFMKFRVNRLKLNSDFSVDIDFRTVHRDMYDLVNGPKPVDVPAPIVPSTATYPPDNLIYNLSTDGDGNVILSGLQIGTYAANVNRVTCEIYSVDGTQSGATCEIHGSVSPTDPTITFAGLPPSVGYALIDQELVYIQSVSGFVASVLRGQLGTTAATHAAQNTIVGTVNSLWPLDLIVGSGLSIAPGMRASNSTPEGNSFVSEYVSSSGLVRLSAPLGTAPTVSSSLHAYPLILPVNVISQMISVPTGFFVSGDTGDWSVTIPLSCSRVVYAQVKATSDAGTDSAWFGQSFTSAPLSTHGGNSFTLTFPQLPAGTTANAFQPVSAPMDQDFFGAYAQITNISGAAALPIPVPVAASALSLVNLTATGTVTLGGSADSTSQVQVKCVGHVIGRRRGMQVYSSPWASNSTLTTLAVMATALSAWLNADPVFSQYYSTTASGAVISIFDLTNNGGTVAVVFSSGTTTYTPAGFSSVLGILNGRSYAFTYVDTTDGWESDLSNASNSSGPTGSYGGAALGNIPVSSDSRVNFINIYAYPDGTTGPTAYKIAQIANTSSDGSGFTNYTDTQVESGLTGLTAYPGPTQPTQVDDLIVKLYRNGVEWFELHIPPNSAQSNIVSGLAMRGLSQNATVTGSVINNIAVLDLTLTLR